MFIHAVLCFLFIPGLLAGEQVWLSLTGVVLSDEGTPIGREVDVELSCLSSRIATRTDFKGRFRIEPAERVFSDTSPFGQLQDRFTRSPETSAACDLRVAAAGYRTKTLNLGVGESSSIRDVGIVFLTPVRRSEATVDVSDLSAPKKARRLFGSAMKAALRGDWGEAERGFQGAVSVHPSYGSAWSGLAICRMMRKDAAGAAEAARRSQPRMTIR